MHIRLKLWLLFTVLRPSLALTGLWKIQNSSQTPCSRKPVLTLPNISTRTPKTDVVAGFDYGPLPSLKYVKNPAPDGHRCGICPTYFQKICAFDTTTNATHIFDNHCIMDLYNCIEGTEFYPMKYDKCLYFSNFAYVHGYKYEDMDYGEDHIQLKHSKKNPDFIDIA